MKKYLIYSIACVLFGYNASAYAVDSDKSPIDDLQDLLEGKYLKDNKLTFSDIPYIGDLPLPKEVRKIFDKLDFTNVVFGTEDDKEGVGFATELHIGADVNVYGVKTRISLEFELPIDLMNTPKAMLAQKMQYRCTLLLPVNWRLSDTFPELKGFDLVLFESVAFNIANFPVALQSRARDFGIKVFPKGLMVAPKAGFSIVGVAKPVGFFKSIAHFLKYYEDFVVVANIPQDPLTKQYDYSKVSFISFFPADIESIKGLTLSGTQFKMGFGPTFGLDAIAALGVPHQKEDLPFFTSVSFSPIEIQLVGALDGVWKNPFDIMPITVEGVGLGIVLNSETLFPIGGSVRGKFFFGKDKWIELALQGKLTSGLNLGTPEGGIGGDDDDDDQAPSVDGVALYGAFKGGIYLDDIVEIYLKMAQKSELISRDFKKKVLSEVPNIGLNKASMYFVPQSTMVAGKFFKKGAWVSGEASILKTRVGLEIKFSGDGFEGKGYIPKLKMGPMTITGLGADLKMNTDDDAAVVHFKTNLTAETEFYADGLMTFDIFGGIKEYVHLDIMKDGVHCIVNYKVEGLDLLLEIRSSFHDNDNEQDFYIKGHMTQSALNDFNKLIIRECTNLVDNADKNLAVAKKKTSDWWDTQIKKLKDTMHKERENVIAALKKEEQHLKNVANTYEQRLSSLENKLAKESKAKFEKAERVAKKCEKGKVLRCPEAGYYYALGGGAWTMQKAVKEMRENKEWRKLNQDVIEASGHVVKMTAQISQVADIYSIDDSIAIAFAKALKEASLGGIKYAGISAEGIGEAGKVLGKLGKNAVNITEVFFDLDVKEIKDKKLPHVIVKGKVLGENISLDSQMDLDDVAAYASKIANEAFKAISKPFDDKTKKVNKPNLDKDMLANYLKNMGKNPASIMIPHDTVVIVTE